MSGVEIIDMLSSLALFADLSRPQLEVVAHTFEEEMFTDGQRILRQGFAGSNFYIILEGEASVRIDGTERALLSRGDFFGEISIMLREPPNADVVAVGPLRCVALAGPDLETFLTAHPLVMLRMLHSEVSRLRSATLWKS